MSLEHKQRSYQTRIAYPTIVLTIVRAWAETENVSVDGDRC